jgi:hypothetical protein
VDLEKQNTPDYVELLTIRRDPPRFGATCRTLVLRTAKAIGAFVALLLVAVVGCRLFAPTPYTGRKALPFSRDAWLASRESGRGERYLMLKDLADTHELRGLTREQLVNLLGPPQPPGYPGFGDLCYYLGPEDSPISMDSEWLVLTMSNGVVSDVDIYVD